MPRRARDLVIPANLDRVLLPKALLALVVLPEAPDPERVMSFNTLAPKDVRLLLEAVALAVDHRVARAPFALFANRVRNTLTRSVFSSCMRRPSTRARWIST